VTEETRPIPGCEGYSAGRDGNIYSASPIGRPSRNKKATPRARALKQATGGHGYLVVTIAGVVHTVHSLVLAAWVGPRPKGFVCRHRNGDKTDNRPSNLVWGTQRENVQDAIDHGTLVVGEKRSNAKLTDEAVRKIRALIAEGCTHTEIGKLFSVPRRRIGRIAEGKAWRHVR